MQRINRLTVILFGLAFASAAPVPGEQPSASRESAPSPTPEPRVVYARVKAYLPDSDDVIASISAVYALYSPVLEARGYAVVASPTSDGCAQAPKRPPGLPPSQPWVLVARLASRSSCTALEQGRLAAAAGASAVINMSPQQSRYIYLLERTVDEAASGAMPAPIPQLSISGGAGLELLDEIYSASDPLILNIGISGGDDISTLGAADIAVAVACIVFSLAVLIYALRVSRRLCAPLPLPEHSSIDDTDAENHVSPELTLCLKHIMSSRIPPHPASRRLQGADAAPPAETSPELGAGFTPLDDCSVCIDSIEIGDTARTLFCGHTFHLDCIDPWLEAQHNCPLCKDDILRPRSRPSLLSEVVEELRGELEMLKYGPGDKLAAQAPLAETSFAVGTSAVEQLSLGGDVVDPRLTGLLQPQRSRRDTIWPENSLLMASSESREAPLNPEVSTRGPTSPRYTAATL